MRFSTGLLALVIAFNASGVFAQSLEVKKMRAGEEAKMSTAVDLTNKRCGTAIKVQFNWAGFDEAASLKTAVAPYCQAALDAIEDLCGDDMGKQAVKEKVKTITCGGAAAPTADLVDGDVKFDFALAPNQNKLLVRGILEKKP